MVILMGFTLSHKRIIYYQQIEEQYVLLLIESMKLVRNILLQFWINVYIDSLFSYPYDFDIIFFYLYDFHIMCTFSIIIIFIISEFITNEINANMIVNVRKIMTLVMSVMVLKQTYKNQ